MKDNGKLRRLIREVAGAIIEDPQMRQWVREMVRLVIVEQDEARKLGHARSFLEGCRERGIRVRWDETKQNIVGSNFESMPADLRAMLTACREEITVLLRRLNEQDRAAEQRQKDQLAKRNGK